MTLPPHRHAYRTAAGFLLGLALLAGPAGAAPKDWALFTSPWSLLSRLWAEIGLEADPSGRPSIGLEADPDGRTAPHLVIGNVGLEMDPNGRPFANPGSQDVGLEADPNGAPHH
ncbi:MAG: hypothetical protein ABJC13_01085 [Acidobacteriota bacterium]